MSIYESLSAIQADFVCPKDNYNAFGKYSFRNAEQMLSILNPLCRKNGVVLVLDDEIHDISGRHYVKARATLRTLDGKESVTSCGWAREAEHKKGSDDAQVTGMASSYARKYALGALFCVDDGEDFDSVDNSEPISGQGSAEPEQVPDDGLEEAKRHLWTAIKTYCEAFGGDPTQTYSDVWQRRDFDESPIWLHALANAYEDGLN